MKTVGSMIHACQPRPDDAGEFRCCCPLPAATGRGTTRQKQARQPRQAKSPQRLPRLRNLAGIAPLPSPHGAMEPERSAPADEAMEEEPRAAAETDAAGPSSGPSGPQLFRPPSPPGMHTLAVAEDGVLDLTGAQLHSLDGVDLPDSLTVPFTPLPPPPQASQAFS